MKSLLLLLILSTGNLTIPLLAQSARLPDCVLYFSISGNSASGSYNNQQVGCADWSMAYANDGFTALTMTFEEAPVVGGVPGAFITFTGTTLAGTNPLTSLTAGYWRGNGYRAYVRVSVTATAGSGTIKGVLYGYRSTDSAGGASSNVTVTNTPLPVAGVGGAGSAQLVACDSSVPIAAAAASTTVIISGVAAQQIHVCGFSLSASSAGTMQLITGTGALCATGTVVRTGPISLNANGVLSYGSGLGSVLRGGVAEDLCVTMTGAGAVGNGIISYAVF